MQRFVGSTFALLLGLASAAYGDVPAMDVTVFNAGGQVAFKGGMNADATFATGNLDPGNYVVQFNARNAAVKNNQFLLVVSAGKRKVIADGVPGRTLMAGGAAMKVNVGPGAKITGQIANDQTEAGAGSSKYRVIDGQRYVWLSSALGSNLGGHWVEEGSPPGGNLTQLTTDDLRKKQDRSFEGSMLNGHHHHAPRPGGD
ncbi:MAG: T9SS type A sorting domain-containing protein [Verrucomicrobiota bacterium]|nr:T9SS type A sorting domain-containing protein [Verrucomicrobiota bacterium]